jgi:hypothetical protein
MSHEDHPRGTNIYYTKRCGKASQHDDAASLHARPVVYVWCVDAGLMAPTSSAVVASESPTSSGTDPCNHLPAF